jgi:CRP-like cAMP-binding protein
MHGCPEESRLKALAPFAELTVAERKMLAPMLDEHTAPPGATRVNQCDHGYEFMLIEEGTVDVCRDGEKIDTRVPGDFFGELAVLAVGGPRNATIVARTPVRLLTLTAHYMRSVHESIPALAERIDRVLA